MSYKAITLWQYSAISQYWRSSLNYSTLVVADYYTKNDGGSLYGAIEFGARITFYGSQNFPDHHVTWSIYVDNTLLHTGTVEATPNSAGVYAADVSWPISSFSNATAQMRLDLAITNPSAFYPDTYPALTGSTVTVIVPYAVNVTRTSSACYIDTDIDHGINMDTAHTNAITVRVGSISETLTYDATGKKATWHPTTTAYGSSFTSLTKTYYVDVDYFYGETKVGSVTQSFILRLPTPNAVTGPGAMTTGSTGTFSVTADVYSRQITVYAANGRATWALTESSGSWTWTPATADVAPYVTAATSTTYYAEIKVYYVGTSPVQTSRTTVSTLTFRAADIAPSLSVTVTDTTTAKTTFGKYVVGQSRLRIVSSYTLAYSATLTELRVQANGHTYGAATVTTGVITSTSENTVVVTVTDSRGQTATTTVTLQILDWFTPRITTFSIHRCKQDGTPDDSGGYCRIDWGIEIAPLDNQNSRSLTVVEPEATVQPTLTAYTQSGSLIAVADTETSYDITMTLADAFESISRTLRLSTAGVVLDILRGGLGLGFGKVAETSEAVEINPDWTLICSKLELDGVDLVQWMQDVNNALRL